MKTHFILIFLSLYTFMYSLSAQYTDSSTKHKDTEFQWPDGIKMALSLTFDDARLTQPDKGIPLLDKYGVRATFYVSPASMLKRVNEWKKAVRNGHEIGNHTINHPCSGNFPFARGRALENYSLEMIKSELDSASKLVKETLGVTPVSFAYPCGQTYVGRGVDTRSYVPIISATFETGRVWMSEAPNDPAYCDMAQLYDMPLDAKSFDQIKLLIDTAKKRGFWLILAGHEMDEEYSEGELISSLKTIEEICKYASDPANGIWLDNVGNIAAYIKSVRK